MHRDLLSHTTTLILFEAFHSVASHAHQVNNDPHLRSTLQDLGPSLTQMQDPPLLRLENDSYLYSLSLLQNLLLDGGPAIAATEVCLVGLCREVLEAYIDVAAAAAGGFMPVGTGKRRELAARAPLTVAALEAVCSLGQSSFEKNLGSFFPLFIGLIRCEHGSSEVQSTLLEMLGTSVGPVLLRSC